MSGLITHMGFRLVHLAAWRGCQNLASIEGVGTSGNEPPAFPAPALYYAFEAQGTDEMGVAHLSSGDTFSLVGGKYFLAAQSSTSKTRYLAHNTTPILDTRNAIVSCWLRRNDSSFSSWVIGGFYSGSSTYTIYWVVDDTIVTAGAWHHVVLYRVGPNLRKIVDCGSPAGCAGAIDADNLFCPLVRVQGYLDEVCWLDLGDAVTDDLASIWAANLYDDGLGHYYRAGLGWL